MTAAAFIPHVTCAKCSGKTLEYGKQLRRYVGRGGKRMLEARCHGEAEIIPFAAEPDAKVVLWTHSSAA